MSDKRTPIGKFIHSSWISINMRAGKYRHLQTVSKCESYKDVYVIFSRQEYKDFCIKNKESILILERPSVDRLDNSKNYEINNIQFIELSENIRKDKTVFKDGKGTCFSCKETKIETDFSKDKRRLNGLSNICKPCDSERNKKRYLLKKQLF